MSQQKLRTNHMRTIVFAISLMVIVLLLCVGTISMTRMASPSMPTLTEDVDLSSAHTLANALEQQMKQWQDNLYLETYAVTYQIDNENLSDSVLTGNARFRFVGWREDWLGKLVSLYNANHLIARVTINVNESEVVEFSHSHGEPFGYDAPLNVSSWSFNEEELFQICDDYGGREFRNNHQVELAVVNATSNRLGREWSLVYNRPPKYFGCTVEMDTGNILVKNEIIDWQKVGNLQEIK